MRTDLLADLAAFEMIEPCSKVQPLGRIGGIEIQPVRDDGESCEPCAVGEEDFWSVYIRYVPDDSKGFGGVDCVADCASFAGAEKLAFLLGSLLGVSVVVP